MISSLIRLVMVIAAIAFVFVYCNRKAAKREAYDTNYEYAKKMSDLKKLISSVIEDNEVESLLISKFSTLEGEQEKLGDYLAEELSFYASTLDANINVIDRSQLQRLIDEQKLHSAGLLDKNTLVNLGEIIGIQAIVTGKYQVLDNQVKIWLRMIDIEKGFVVFTERIDLSIEKDLEHIITEDKAWW